MTVHWTSNPQLHRPVLVAAFEGWNDAADAASDAVRRLASESHAEPCAALDAEEYYDFQVARPRVELVDGVTRTIEWPSCTFSAGTLRDARRDLVLLLGSEPNLHWRRFCDDVITVARTTGCELVVTLGALLGDVPHSRPVTCTGSATDAALTARLGLERSRYEGPTGIVGVLHDAVRRAGFAAASLWAPVPHYVATPPSPKATRALLAGVVDLLRIPLDLTDLDIAAAAWERTVADAVSGDAEIREYVAMLEQRFDQHLEPDDDDRDDGAEFDDIDGDDWFDEEALPSGDALAADIEQYLREQGDGS